MSKGRSSLGIVIGLSCFFGFAEPSSAQATEPEARGVELGARLGYQLPGGEFRKGSPMGDELSNGALVALDVGYRVHPLLALVASGVYVPSLEFKTCPGCSASGLRAGVSARVHPLRGASGLPVDPWLSIGVGYDTLTTQVRYYDSITRLNTDETRKASGFEAVNLAVGADLAILPELAAFAFASYSRAAYTTWGDAKIGDPSAHHFVVLGVGGRYRL